MWHTRRPASGARSCSEDDEELPPAPPAAAAAAGAPPAMRSCVQKRHRTMTRSVGHPHDAVLRPGLARAGPGAGAIQRSGRASAGPRQCGPESELQTPNLNLRHCQGARGQPARPSRARAGSHCPALSAQCRTTAAGHRDRAVSGQRQSRCAVRPYQLCLGGSACSRAGSGSCGPGSRLGAKLDLRQGNAPEGKAPQCAFVTDIPGALKGCSVNSLCNSRKRRHHFHGRPP